MATKEYLHPPAFPAEFILALAGLALLGTIGSSLAMALADDGSLEAAVITFVATASSVDPFGIGAAFRGLIAGATAPGVLSRRTTA